MELSVAKALVNAMETDASGTRQGWRTAGWVLSTGADSAQLPALRMQNPGQGLLELIFLEN